MLFVDDDPFQRAEVKSQIPDIHIFEAIDPLDVLGLESVLPANATEEDKKRVQLFIWIRGAISICLHPLISNFIFQGNESCCITKCNHHKSLRSNVKAEYGPAPGKRACAYWLWRLENRTEGCWRDEDK